MARKPTDQVQLKLRFTEALRRRLEREAKRQERSLNAEIVSRLDQSFRKSEDAELTADAWRTAFGERIGDLFRAFATAIWLIERRTGKKWYEDRETHFQVRSATDAILETFARHARPLNAEQTFLRFRLRESPSGNKNLRILYSGEDAALEALQKMGLAPSDAEIDESEAAKRFGRPTQTKGGGQ